ncbi:MAG: acyl-CoA carboxylase subunit beta [Nitrospirae bacterium]|nr:acyl-CoA carboxylase subunit beta [Nitrospirota bacterium]
MGALEFWQAQVEDLEKRRSRACAGGGPEKVQRQHDRGKLTARERIDLLFDTGTFVEMGVHGTQMMTDEYAAADGVVAGYGKVNGRPVCVIAYDFTVFGGSMGQVGETKATRMRELALKERMPLVWLVDSGGARIRGASGLHPDMVSLFAGTGHLFREEVIMSGVVPLVAAMMGPGMAGTAYIPGLADFVPMVKNVSSMALGGPPLVKAVTGEDINENELGGAKVHCEMSGCGDLEVENDQECIKIVKDYLSYFPLHNGEKPPIVPCDDPIDRRDEEAMKVVPDNPRGAYDMHKLIKIIADHGKFLEIKPKWARNLVTCLARIGGRPCGIVANNPLHYGGVLDVNASDKAARFIWLCDAFNIPLVFLQDVPGFMVGSKVEKEGIIRHGSKMLFAVSEATVPKLTVVVRKAYGAGYYVMCGRAFEPDLIVGWPTAEISVMGAEGMVGIFGRSSKAAEMSEEAKKNMAEMIKPYINAYKSAGWALVDDIIDPRETRLKLARGLEMFWNKTVERPWRKHGVLPV